MSAELGSIAALVSGSAREPGVSPRLRSLHRLYELRVFTQTNRLFLWLLPAQWCFAVVVATWWSPVGAAGSSPIVVAVVLGALITLPTVAVIRWQPHHIGTRCVVAVGQLGFSA